jgi:hypothetical protein
MLAIPAIPAIPAILAIHTKLYCLVTRGGLLV